MENSLFQKLPRELRDEIYALTLHLDKTIDLKAIDSKPKATCKVTKHKPLALTETCRQIRAECHSLFYSLNHFQVEIEVCADPANGTKQDCLKFISTLESALQTWASQIGNENLTAIPSVNISLFSGPGGPTWEDEEDSNNVANSIVRMMNLFKTPMKTCTFSFWCVVKSFATLGPLYMFEIQPFSLKHKARAMEEAKLGAKRQLDDALEKHELNNFEHSVDQTILSSAVLKIMTFFYELDTTVWKVQVEKRVAQQAAMAAQQAVMRFASTFYR